jgi:hypothetical protein
MAVKPADVVFQLLHNTAAATIVSSSVANPTVITTSAAHGLATGDTVTIAGHADSTPDINGEEAVTVTGPTTFTVDQDVSVGGTGGTATPLVAPGRTNMVSTIAANFDVVAPAGRKNLNIQRVVFQIIDGGMTLGKFGGLTALTTGCKVTVVDPDGNEQVDFLNGTTIKTNGDFNLLAGVDALVEPAAGDDSMPVRWTLTRGLGGPLSLPTGWRLRFRVQDDLSGITTFRAMSQGYLK